MPVLRALLAALLAPLLLTGLLTAVTVVPAAPAVADRASESSGAPDPQVGPQSCALMGRTYVRGGCSRTSCVRSGERVRRSPNAETCLVGGRDGAAYGTEVDARTCARLHRRFVPAVNFCASQPYRGRVVTEAAPQCIAPFTTYVVASSTTGGRATRREAEGRYDACLRPQKARRLQAEAQRTGASLRSLVLQLTQEPVPVDPPPAVLMVGDSLTWRGTDELARRRPGWIVDGMSGRNLRELAQRLDRFEATHGTPAGLVIALGTNPAPAFDAGDLRTVVGRLPETVPVMVVTPYRDPRRNPRVQVRAVDRADGLLRDLADTRPLTCVADWRGLVSSRRDLLVDGTHQTRSTEQRWAQLVSRSWDSCASL